MTLRGLKRSLRVKYVSRPFAAQRQGAPSRYAAVPHSRMKTDTGPEELALFESPREKVHGTFFLFSLARLATRTIEIHAHALNDTVALVA